ncbi:MAG: hypothetical protein ACI9LM_003487 [Alteromonadaceae bacterium]|jgi:hypothetical protein
MICHQDKCLFVHIPKTAGQSIESVFVKRMGLTWQDREALLLRPNVDINAGPPRLAHLFASEYIKCRHISREDFNRYFKFSFVRNPWARIVSEYNYRRNHSDSRYQCDFKTFLFEQLPTARDDNYSLAKDYHRHILPQVDFLYDNDGRCLVDFIGKFENLQRDFDKVCQRLEIAPQALPHKNKTGGKQRLKTLLKKVLQQEEKRQHYSHYYDDQSRDFVAKLYVKDIEVFDYHFEDKQA